MTGERFPAVLDAEQAARFLRLPGARSVERLARRGELPYVRIGGRRLFLRASLLEALRARETPVRDQKCIEARLAEIRGRRRIPS